MTGRIEISKTATAPMIARRGVAITDADAVSIGSGIIGLRRRERRSERR